MNTVAPIARALVLTLMDIRSAALQLPADPVLDGLILRSILRVASLGGLSADEMEAVRSQNDALDTSLARRPQQDSQR